MTLGEFIKWLTDNHCDLVPMPEWNRANTLQIIHRRSGRTASLNTNIRGDVHVAVIEGICTRLGVGFPPDYL